MVLIDSHPKGSAEDVLRELIEQLRLEHAASPHGGRHCVSGCHLTGCRTRQLVDAAADQLHTLRSARL